MVLLMAFWSHSAHAAALLMTCCGDVIIAEDFRVSLRSTDARDRRLFCTYPSCMIGALVRDLSWRSKTD